MIIITEKEELTKFLRQLPDSETIGFVPTMGALHAGHFSLIERAKLDCSVVLCSIFVNPTQFNNKDDFNKYPNTIAQDLTNLEKINCSVVFSPKVTDLYNEGEQSKKYDFDGLDTVLEGKFRPGHFDGVATVIEKFFDIIHPHKAYFGLKDLQQYLIVKLLTKKLQLPIEIIGVPTVREQNGLALSSRNQRLSQEQLVKARMLYQYLLYCKENLSLFPFSLLRTKVEKRMEETKGVRLEYLELVNLHDLTSVEKAQNEGGNAICIAAFVDDIRLIDNIIF